MLKSIAILAGVALVSSAHPLRHDRFRKAHSMFPRIEFHCNCPKMENDLIPQHDPSDLSWNHKPKFDPKQDFVRENKVTHQACALITKEHPGLFETQIMSQREEPVPITHHLCAFWNPEGESQAPFTIFNNQFCKAIDPDCVNLTFRYVVNKEGIEGKNITPAELEQLHEALKDD